MLFNSVDDRMVTNMLPKTYQAMEQWDGKDLPEEEVFEAFYLDYKKLVEEKTPVPNGKTVHTFDDNTSKQINNNEQKKDGDLLDNVYPV